MHASLDFSKSTNEKQVSNLEWPYQTFCVVVLCNVHFLYVHSPYFLLIPYEFAMVFTYGNMDFFTSI